METTIAQSVGVVIEPGMTALEAVMKHRGMNWDSEFAPIFYQTSSNRDDVTVDCEYTEYLEKKAVLRSDTKDCLGIVGASYQPIPNRLAFGIADTIDGEIVGAGEYERGATSWLQMRLNKDSLPILGDDVIDQYLLIVTGHAGNKKRLIVLTPTRVVCRNTLNSAERGGTLGETKGSIRHSGDVKGKVDLSDALLKKIGKFFVDAQQHYIGFAKTQVGQPVVEDYFKRVENVTPSNYVVNNETGQLTNELKGRKRNMFDRYMVAYHGDRGGADMPGVRGTLWGAYNAVTYVQDHDIVEEKRRESGGKSANDRAAYQLFESGPNVKQRAFNIAQELTENRN